MGLFNYKIHLILCGFSYYLFLMGQSIVKLKGDTWVKFCLDKIHQKIIDNNSRGSQIEGHFTKYLTSVKVMKNKKRLSCYQS